jgi:hypothetical protein
MASSNLACCALAAAVASSVVNWLCALVATADKVARVWLERSTATCPSSIAEEMPSDAYCWSNHARALVVRVAIDGGSSAAWAAR